MGSCYIDIGDKEFQRLKEHETSRLLLNRTDYSQDFAPGDVLKLYHPGDPAEALRVSVVKVTGGLPEGGPSEEADGGECEEMICLETELLEWVFQIETELDAQLREEKLWLESL